MSLVRVWNEWDPLEEVIVGNAVGARVPQAGPDVHALEFSDLSCAADIPSGPYPAHVLSETQDELDSLADALESLGAVVRRPEQIDRSAQITTPDWSTDGFHDYCPRDGLLALGDTIIETPMVLRSRAFESRPYRELLLEYLDSGARWLSAPRPLLLDDMFDPAAPPGSRLKDHEPAFDAANIVRLGSDLLYLVSDSGNERGWRWLQSALGDSHKVHPCRGIYASTHIDSTIVPLHEGLVLLNPERVNEANVPAALKDWERVWCPELVDIGYTGRSHASTWIGMNLLVVRPGLVIAEARQSELHRVLNAHGIDVLPLSLTHARTLGGGFHCVTLDVRRGGS